MLCNQCSLTRFQLTPVDQILCKIWAFPNVHVTNRLQGAEKKSSTFTTIHHHFI
jgi:hypothetical protein